MKYETMNWDAGWAELVDPLVEVHEGEPSENDTRLDRLEEKYDRRCVESAQCKLYAERLMANLQTKYDQYEFAAHTDATGYPPNSYWRILARMPKGRPLPEAELKKLQGAAKAILRNIEKKYPGVGERYQKQMNEEARFHSKKQAAAIGFGVRFADEKPRRGCLWVLLVFLFLGIIIHQGCSVWATPSERTNMAEH